MQMKLSHSTRFLLIASLLFVVACDNNTTPATPAPSTAVSTPTTAVLPTDVPATGTPAQKESPTPLPPTPEPTQPPSPTNPPTAGAQSPTPGANLQGCARTTVGAGRDGLGDSLFPNLGNSGYDALHYTLDLSVDVVGNVVSGTTTMRAQAASNLDAFNLDFEDFSISAVTVNGKPALYSHARHELTITPAIPLKVAETFTVTVAYSGEPNINTGNPIAGEQEYALGWTHYSGGVFVASEPSGAASFFPVNDHPCDKATYTLRITVPDPYVVAANGILKDTVDNGSTNTYHFETRDPMASYLVTVGIARFDLQTQQGPSGLPIRNYFESSLEQETRDYFKRTPEMIDYFSKVYGPYPFDVYGVVVIDDPLGFAIETQTLALFGRNVGNSRVGAEQVVAHELSHQWFGDSVSVASWKDIWLNEGFASMSEWLWIEHDKGKSAYDSYVRGVYGYAKENDLLPPGNPPADDLFNQGVYVRGGLTLHALRKEVGDDAFFRTLQTYTARYRNGNADTQDFISVAEEVSGKKLGSLFDTWLYSEQIPPLP